MAYGQVHKYMNDEGHLKKKVPKYSYTETKNFRLSKKTMEVTESVWVVVGSMLWGFQYVFFSS